MDEEQEQSQSKENIEHLNLLENEEPDEDSDEHDSNWFEDEEESDPVEQFRDEDRIPVDGRGPGFMNNKSHDGHANRGPTSKLNQAQQLERLEMHARRVSTGRPTLKGICKYWYEQYGISMTHNSEVSYAKNNHKRIWDKKNEMEQSGQIVVTHTGDQQLAYTITHAGKKICSVMEDSARMIKDIYAGIKNDDFNSKEINAEQYLKLEDEDKKEKKRKDIEFLLRVSDQRYKNLKTVSDIAEKHGNLLNGFIKSLKQMNDDNRGSKESIKKTKALTSKAEYIKKQMASVEGQFDPLQPIDDEQRKATE